MKEYSYCESVTASGSSPWHIRELTEKGRKLSGGIDTNSLCERVKAPYGWDLQYPVGKHLTGTCRKCFEVYSSRVAQG